MKTQHIKFMRCHKSGTKREVRSDICLHLKKKKKKRRKNSNRQPTFNLKELEKEEQAQPKVNRRKEMAKIRAKINKIEKRKIGKKSNEIKSWVF